MLTHVCSWILHVIIKNHTGCCSNKTCDLWSCSHSLSGDPDRFQPKCIRNYMSVYISMLSLAFYVPDNFRGERDSNHTVCYSVQWKLYTNAPSSCLVPHSWFAYAKQISEGFGICTWIEAAHSHQQFLSCISEFKSVFALFSSGWSFLQIKSVESRKVKSKQKWSLMMPGTSQVFLDAGLNRTSLSNHQITLFPHHTVFLRKKGKKRTLWSNYLNL